MSDSIPKKVAVKDLLLDSSNPRHSGTMQAESELIAELLKSEKVLNLAADISKNGLNPIDRIGIIAHPNTSLKSKYIVVEGNRRVCALKLLNDPNLAIRPADKRRLTRLNETGTQPPQKLDVALFSSRESARKWLSVRHGGEQDGVGIRTWSSVSKTRFNIAAGGKPNPNQQSQWLLDHIVDNGLLDSETVAGVSLTTIARYMNTPQFRTALGLQGKDDYSSDHSAKDFNKLAKQFVQDAIAGALVSSRTNSADRIEYARQLLIRCGVASGPAGNTRNSSRTNSTATGQSEESTDNDKSDDSGINADNGGGSGKSRRSSNNPNTRSKVVVQFPVRSGDDALKKLFIELKNIPPNFPFAANYLLRAVLERVVTLYLHSVGVSTTNKKLHQRINLCCDKLVSAGVEEKQLKALRVSASSSHSSASPDTLGAVVHGNLHPSFEQVKINWDSLKGPIRIILDKLAPP